MEFGAVVLTVKGVATAAEREGVANVAEVPDHMFSDSSAVLLISVSPANLMEIETIPAAKSAKVMQTIPQGFVPSGRTHSTIITT